jgi:hypothetical protein
VKPDAKHQGCPAELAQIGMNVLTAELPGHALGQHIYDRDDNNQRRVLEGERVTAEDIEEIVAVEHEPRGADGSDPSTTVVAKHRDGRWMVCQAQTIRDGSIYAGIEMYPPDTEWVARKTSNLDFENTDNPANTWLGSKGKHAKAYGKQRDKVLERGGRVVANQYL